MEPIALRLDDVGACSKRYEIYSDRAWRVGPLAISANWLFLKYLPQFRGWGPYRELTAAEWHLIFNVLERHRAKLTVAITAAWPEDQHRLIPFPQRFPDEAAVLKVGVHAGLIEIANHGLTHCVLQHNAFKPRWFSSNRTFHREFWEWIPPYEQEEHMRRSQDILQEYFQVPILTLVPPGNVFSDATLEIAARHGLRYVSCRTPRRLEEPLAVLGNDDTVAFHDRDLVLYGLSWLTHQLESCRSKRFCFVKELGEELTRVPSAAPREELVVTSASLA